MVYWYDLYKDKGFGSENGLLRSFKLSSVPAEAWVDASGHELFHLIGDYFLMSRKLIAYHDENEGFYPWFSHDSTTFYVNPYAGGLNIDGCGQ